MVLSPCIIELWQNFSGNVVAQASSACVFRRKCCALQKHTGETPVPLCCGRELARPKMLCHGVRNGRIPALPDVRSGRGDVPGGGSLTAGTFAVEALLGGGFEGKTAGAVSF